MEPIDSLLCSQEPATVPVSNISFTYFNEIGAGQSGF